MVTKQQIELLKSYLNGDLTPERRKQCELLLSGSRELRRELDELRRVHELIRSSDPSFEPYFSTRLMARLEAQPNGLAEWSAGLALIFRRIAMAVIFLIVTAAAYNVSTQWEHRTDSNVLELALALPPATVQTSLQYLDFEQ